MIDDIFCTKDFSFADYTTYALGGKAEKAYFPATEEEGAQVFEYLTENNKKFVILGNGSNILASDKNFDGEVILISRLDKIYPENGYLRCEAGVTVNKLLKYCKEHSLGGLEYLYGIPASVGGLALMNGGIPERHIGDDIVSVRIFDGKIKEFDRKTCNFGNKHSTMRGINCIILSLLLQVKPTNEKNIEERTAKYRQIRKIQPSGKSCGCVFKNPSGQSAGEIIEKCGLKGTRVGGAFVSEKHANFIINDGATAEEVFTLINLIKRKVLEKTGILLEEEVVYIGEFNEINC